MNKSDLLEVVADRLKHLSKKEIDFIIDLIFNKMTEALVKEDRIEIRGFGSFEVRTREARQGRNPKTGDKVFVKTRKVPFFKVGKELREKINDGDSSVSEELPLSEPQQRASGE